MTRESNKPDGTLGSGDKYLFGLKKKTDALGARIRLPAYLVSENQQKRIRLYFMERASQVGEACFRVHDLDTPLSVLMRVLCEDLILLYWTSLSEQNAAEYAKWPTSEVVAVARVNIERGRAAIRHQQTGQDATEAILPKLSDLVEKRKSLEQIAKEAGLGAVYDLLYRFGSLVPHAKSFDLFPEQGDERRLAELAAINALLAAVILVVDTPAGALAPSEVLKALGME
jgi:Family of unknown function (DUF5677)